MSTRLPPPLPPSDYQQLPGAGTSPLLTPALSFSLTPALRLGVLAHTWAPDRAAPLLAALPNLFRLCGTSPALPGFPHLQTPERLTAHPLLSGRGTHLDLEDLGPAVVASASRGLYYLWQVLQLP